MYHDTDREERSSMIEMTEAENDSLGEMTEAEYGVLGEAAEAEYGICDLLDENIPSPLETDNAGETLVLPEIQDMTEYIRRHYEQEIMKKLAWRLRWEELCVVSDGKYYQDLPWTGSEDYGEEVSLPGPEDVIPKDFDDPRFADEKTRYATLQPKEVKIVFASYYRVSECCVEARLTVEAQVEIRWRFLGKTVPQRYDVDMWFDMEGDMNGEICQIALHRYRSEASGVKLDEYLVLASTTVKQQTQLSTKRSETFLNGDVAGRFFWRISNVLRTRTETNRVTAAVIPRKAIGTKIHPFSFSPKRRKRPSESKSTKMRRQAGK